MRRILVIFLILLFPLNVLALSLSASPVQLDGASAQAVQPAAAADIDPAESPSVTDLHDLVNQERCLHLAGAGAGAVPPHEAAPICHSLAPPVKPPRIA